MRNDTRGATEGRHHDPAQPIMARALAKRPPDRFQTAAPFSAALLAAFRGRPAAEALPPAPPEAERIAFLPRVRRLAVGDSVASHSPRPVTAASAAPVAPAPALVFDAVLLARCEKQLALHVGPLARLLIKRATPESGNVARPVHSLGRAHRQRIRAA
ncbi:MAG: hypothetical protein H7306_23000 [Bacteriovorax sp.]|nr:hypothetical protein [Rhizobacter sp.]